MALIAPRKTLTLAFLIASPITYFLLQGYAYRLQFSAIPLLFGVQILLSDSLEGFLTEKAGYMTRWFTLLIAPGTILHEISHLTAAKLTGCNITSVRLFSPNPKTGVLGYVSYTQPQDRWTVFREVIIGFAPFFGCGAILLAVNTLYGGELTNMITRHPLSNVGPVLDFMKNTAYSLLKTSANMNLENLSGWILIYLQMCFSVGAAPSTQDFKSTLSSFKKNIISAALFLSCAVSAVLLSQQHFDLGQYTETLADSVGILLSAATLILTLSTITLTASIPVAYVGAKIAKTKTAKKLLPLLLAAVTYIIFGKITTTEYSLAGAVLVFFVMYLKR